MTAGATLLATTTLRGARPSPLHCVAQAGSRMSTNVKRSKLQLLFDLANRIFAEHKQPTPTQVDVLKLALSSVPLAELGIPHSEECACAEESCPGNKLCQGDSSELQQYSPNKHVGPRPSITYLHIHENDTLSLGIFCLPANAQIPLHNHPGMTVLSRVLYGKMHVKSFDWSGAEGPSSSGGGSAAAAAAAGECQRGGPPPRQAVRVLDKVLTAGDEPAVLFPSSGGNIHQFTAVTDCAVLDLLSPPYSTDDGRDCIYYQEVAGEGEGEVQLLEFEPPADFTIDSGTYKGLPIRTRPYLLRSILAAAAATKSPSQPASPEATSFESAQHMQQQAQQARQQQAHSSQGKSGANGSGGSGGAGGEESSGSRTGGGGGAGSPTISSLKLEGGGSAAAGAEAGRSPPAKSRRQNGKKSHRSRG